MSEPTQLEPAYANDTSSRLAKRSADSTESPHGSGLRKYIIIAVVLALVALVAWRIYAGKQAAQAEADKTAAQARRPVPVQVSVVQQRTVPVFLTALGTVTAYNTVTVNARVSGQLLHVNFREGQNVHKGQLLMEIDPAPYKAALDQAIGQLAKDEANQKNTAAESQRYTALFNAGVVSKETQQLQVSNEGQAAGTIKADQASIEAARVNLNYTRITSPIDGVVGLRQVDPGNIVNAGSTSGSSSTSGLVVITQIHPISIIFTLPEDQLPQVQRAMQASPQPLVVEAYDRTDAHKIAAGTLLTIDNQIDTTTGTAKLKAVFDNADNALFANQFVNVRLVLTQRPNAIVVPTAAISTGTQGDFVFAVNPGPTPAAKRKNLPGANSSASASGSSGHKSSGSDNDPATTGKDGKPRTPYHVDTEPVHVDFVIGTNSVLADGTVKPGQQVVVDGQEKLVDGANVTPQLAPAQASAAPSPNPPPPAPPSAHAGTHTDNGKGQP
jgi:multidrug efflux system membrane fusion protein